MGQRRVIWSRDGGCQCCRCKMEAFAVAVPSFRDIAVYEKMARRSFARRRLEGCIVCIKYSIPSKAIGRAAWTREASGRERSVSLWDLRLRVRGSSLGPSAARL